eukprot:TRINITY_DN67794_c0_g1_i10.p1 TRINITY_DN67794_c0_g1~~TRINITY_DN67794_c0_g1_i10.p1  ORF type:complete len:101 (+),score=12.21 TRINITY_DN67794_c0_g1_i10:353-655(+)
MWDKDLNTSISGGRMVVENINSDWKGRWKWLGRNNKCPWYDEVNIIMAIQLLANVECYQTRVRPLRERPRTRRLRPGGFTTDSEDDSGDSSSSREASLEL